MPAKKVAKRSTGAKRSGATKKSATAGSGATQASAKKTSGGTKKSATGKRTSAAKKRSTANAPWKRKAPPGSKHTTLTPEQKAWARAQAKKAGRRYPNLVDNMRAAQRG